MQLKSPLHFGLATFALALGLGTPSALGFVTVTVLPSNQVVFVGSNAVFTAQVSTNAGEIITGYTWQMSTNGSSPFNTIPGAATAICTLSNVQTADDGYYFAKVTYNSGTNVGLVSVSAAVRLVVQDQARIVSQPQASLACLVGTNASFTVGALGLAPLRYQWRVNGTNLVNGPRVSGANSATLALTNLVVADSGSYTVVVTNIYAAVTSQVAVLGVFGPPEIIAQPLDLTVIAGSNAGFRVTVAASDALGYRWQKDGFNLSDGGRIIGATSNVLTIAGAITNDEGSYSVIVTNPIGSVTSVPAALTVWVPATFSSATNAAGRQGASFTYLATATGTLPITFGVDALPSGLSLDPINGVISGIPVVTGIFYVTLFATNVAMTTTGQLVITLTTGVPGITSALAANGKQGQSFNYFITASNSPAFFSARSLPAGLGLSPASGAISGVPLVSGAFSIPIGATNEYGGDSNLLTLTLTSSVPVITSARTATGTENQSGFTYRIRASNSPTLFGASNLPLGLTVNPATGLISGTPWTGGTFIVPIWANNAWGTGTTNLVVTISYAPLAGLYIADVTTTWSKPFVLDFAFSLRDGPDPTTSNPVVRPPSEFQLLCMEDGVPIASEAPLIFDSVTGSSSKQLKTFLALDYTYSMYVVPGAIEAMEEAAQLLINEEPPHALFGIIEFNADYMAPQFVTNKLTSPNNYFISDKVVLGQSIAGIQDNYVRGNYAGTRCWDAMYAALNQFGANNPDEQRYLVAMTDGNDDASLLNTTSDPLDAVNTLIKLARKNHVAIYCVAFGDDVNTTALQMLTSQTGGRYYLASETSDLSSQFQRIRKDISGQYVLRWATLKRAIVPAYPVPGFQPSFQISHSGFTDSWNTNIVYTNVVEIDDTVDPPVTNEFTTNAVQFPFNPPDWTNDVRLGSLRLVPDADLGLQSIRLRATYVPRYVRQVRLNYRPNYACTAALESTGTNELLYGWAMTETTDTNGLRTLTMSSPDPTNLLTSIKYAAFGELLSFNFTYPEALTSTQAFSVFSVDNSIYTNMIPTGQRFTNENFAKFTTLYPLMPPHGTPVPWLISYGFKTNFDAAELIATNGLPVWQAYLAGLNPTNVNSRFSVVPAFTTGQTPQFLFSTVSTRTYRVEASTTLGEWVLLRDNIAGTGGDILFIDNRNLSSVNRGFYRVGVY